MAAEGSASPLAQFLANEELSIDRESLLAHRIIYDLKLVAAKKQRSFFAHRVEFDTDGVDWLFDDGDTVRKVQIKSVYEDAKTQNWAVHSRLLRPFDSTSTRIGLPAHFMSSGFEGGVILIEAGATSEQSLAVKYHYTDALVLAAMIHGIFKIRKPRSIDTVKSVWEELKKLSTDKKLQITKSAFVTAKSERGLFGLLGLNRLSSNNWRRDLMDFLDVELDPVHHKSKARHKESFKKNASEDLQTLCV